MKRLALVAVLFFLNVGCTSARTINFPTGDSGFRIRCETIVNAFVAGEKSACHKKAAEMCPEGFEVVDPGTGLGPDPFKYKGGKTTLNYEMAVKCDQP
jgi:hypothetical protein